MYPTICQIGPLTIHSYGLLLAIAVLVCAVLASRDGRAEGIKPETIYDLVFWAVLSGILGARVFYVLLNLDFFLENPGEIVMVQRGGLAWQGGLTGGALVAFIFIRRRGLDLLKTLDLLAPYLALGQAIGRVGCFFNGCCYGREVAWGVYFPVHGAHLHPTQLYQTAALLIIFFILKRFRSLSNVPGQVFALYLILAALQRFVIEFFRADHFNTVFGLSVYQYVCIGLFLAGVGLNAFLTKRR